MTKFPNKLAFFLLRIIILSRHVDNQINLVRDLPLYDCTKMEGQLSSHYGASKSERSNSYLLFATVTYYH